MPGLMEVLQEALRKTSLKQTPFGTPAIVSKSGILGGDAALGPMVFTPENRPGSEPHELFHSGFQSMPLGSGLLIDALLGRASQFGYGPQAAYRNPSERAAYGYQEGVTGVADPMFRSSASPEMVAALPQSPMRMTVRNLLDALGDVAERGGRWMGERNR